LNGLTWGHFHDAEGTVIWVKAAEGWHIPEEAMRLPSEPAVEAQNGDDTGYR